MTLSPEAVLAEIPGWEAATCEVMTGGLTNQTWRVNAGDRKGVLKIDDGERVEPLNARCAEASVQDMAAKAGLAANVILATEGFYLTEFIEGTVWTRQVISNSSPLR